MEWNLRAATAVLGWAVVHRPASALDRDKCRTYDGERCVHVLAWGTRMEWG